MKILTRGCTDEVALVLTDSFALYRRSKIAAYVDTLDTGAKVTFRSRDQIYYAVHAILPLLTSDQRERFECHGHIVLDDALTIPSRIFRFAAKDPHVCMTVSAVTWTASDYSGSESGTFETYGIKIVDLGLLAHTANPIKDIVAQMMEAAHNGTGKT